MMASFWDDDSDFVGPYWEYWKFGMQEKDMEDDLARRYNTVTVKLDDMDMFRVEAAKLAHKAETKDEFLQSLEAYRKVRIGEVNEMIRVASSILVAQPSIFEKDIHDTLWENFVRMSRSSSLSAGYGYFRSMIPDHNYQRLARLPDNRAHYRKMKKERKERREREEREEREKRPKVKEGHVPYKPMVYGKGMKKLSFEEEEALRLKHNLLPRERPPHLDTEEMSVMEKLESNTAEAHQAAGAQSTVGISPKPSEEAGAQQSSRSHTADELDFIEQTDVERTSVISTKRKRIGEDEQDDPKNDMDTSQPPWVMLENTPPPSPRKRHKRDSNEQDAHRDNMTLHKH